MVLLRLGQKGSLVDVSLDESHNYIPFSTPDGKKGLYQVLISETEIIVRSRDDESSDLDEETAGYVLREYCWYGGEWSVYLMDGWGEYFEQEDEESIANLRAHFGK